MKLYAFGDSWTAGQGANIRIENSLDSVEERRIFRNNNKQIKCREQIITIRLVVFQLDLLLMDNFMLGH